MTTEEALKRMPIIQAYAEGKTVQCRPYKACDSMAWMEFKVTDGKLCDFFCPLTEWRIKPEPWEGHVYLDKDGVMVGCGYGRRIKVRQVPE